MLLILIVAVAAVLIALATGFLDINQVRGGQPPQVSAENGAVTAKGAQAPAFDVSTGSIKVGTTEANVKLPTLEVRRPGNEAAAVSNNAM